MVPSLLLIFTEFPWLVYIRPLMTQLQISFCWPIFIFELMNLRMKGRGWNLNLQTKVVPLCSVARSMSLATSTGVFSYYKLSSLHSYQRIQIHQEGNIQQVSVI